MTEAKTEHTLELIKAARLLNFKPETGWPQTFNHFQLAKLQTWHEGIENTDWRKEAANWRELLRLVVESGAMEHTTTTERVQVTPAERRILSPGLGSSEWHERGFGYTPAPAPAPARDQEVTHHHIAAPAFAAWLAVQGNEPTPLVAAWFKAQAVGRTASAAAPAPVVAGSASNAPMAKGTAAERRTRWLAMFEAEEKREPRGALQRLADREGVDRSNMGKAIAKAKTERAKQSRAGGWTSQLVQDGKRTG